MRLCFWSSSGYQLLSFFSNCKDWGNASHSNYTSDHRYLFLGCNSNINRRGKRSFFFPLFGRKRGGISSWDRSEGQYLISFGAVTPGWEEMVWFCIAPLYLLLNTLIGCNATPSSNSSILITWVSLAVGVRLWFFFLIRMHLVIAAIKGHVYSGEIHSLYRLCCHYHQWVMHPMSDHL